MVLDNKVNAHMFAQIFDEIPIGLFIIGKNRAICAWNKWMVKNTNLDVDTVIGQQLKTLYPDNVNLRFEWALDQVLEFGNPQVLSSILNRFVIPISIAKKTYLDMEIMQQNIEILPIAHNNETMALVVVQDVSDKVNLKNTLLSLANKFEKHSLIDALTGTYNRRYLWQYLDDQLSEAKRDNYNIFCCIYDLDYFKKINDEFGHDAGDDVLISFVAICKSHLGERDLFFRYGGEEFVMISTHITKKEAIILYNRVRKALESTPSHGKVDKIITCSGGVAYWESSTSLKTPKQLIKEADIELYQAKKFGRNCIFIDNQRFE